MQKGPDELEVKSLALSRGGRLLFRELDFVLQAGEFLSLEGPNGAGKTSLLRAIAGFLQPESGNIRLRMNGEIFSEPDERALHVGWLGDKEGVKAQMTPFELLRFFQTLTNSEGDIEEKLASVGLARVRDLQIQYLSAGQKRRLALARLRLISRPLWLLDEPLSALDGEGKAMVTNSIAAHCRAGGLAVAATHEPLAFQGKRIVVGSHPA